jgi:hypothetical protein
MFAASSGRCSFGRSSSRKDRYRVMREARPGVVCALLQKHFAHFREDLFVLVLVLDWKRWRCLRRLHVSLSTSLSALYLAPLHTKPSSTSTRTSTSTIWLRLGRAVIFPYCDACNVPKECCKLGGTLPDLHFNDERASLVVDKARRINGGFGRDIPIVGPQRLTASKRLGPPPRRRACQNPATRKRPAQGRSGPPCRKRPA